MRLGRDQTDAGLLRLLLGDEHLHVAGRAELVLALDGLQGTLCGRVGSSERGQGLLMVCEAGCGL